MIDLSTVLDCSSRHNGLLGFAMENKTELANSAEGLVDAPYRLLGLSTAAALWPRTGAGKRDDNTAK